jgi:hypothetical protein
MKVFATKTKVFASKTRVFDEVDINQVVIPNSVTFERGHSFFFERIDYVQPMQLTPSQPC